MVVFDVSYKQLNSQLRERTKAVRTGSESDRVFSLVNEEPNHESHEYRTKNPFVFCSCLFV